MSRPDTLVVIPAFNEEGTVADVVGGVRDAVPGADVLVVDDGSDDATAALGAAAGAQVMTLPVNVGYGAALQAGYKHAVRSGYQIVAQLDADGQHDPAELPLLLERLGAGDADVVVGSRFLEGGSYRSSTARRAGIAIFSRIASVVTRQPISDPTSGFQVMRLRVAAFFCSEVYPTDYPDADILILLHRSGFRIVEVPVRMSEAVDRGMHGGHRGLYYAYKMSLSIFVTLLRKGAVHD